MFGFRGWPIIAVDLPGAPTAVAIVREPRELCGFGIKRTLWLFRLLII
jgi:hypothetical protein